MEAPSVRSAIHFIRREDRHKHEKPYAFRFEAETDLPQSNFIVDLCNEIQIEDIRGRQAEFTIEKHGFSVVKLPFEIQNSWFYDTGQLERYFRRLETFLRAYLGADNVRIFRHAVRKRHPDFPISTGGSYSFDQPTSVAHIDTTLAECLREVAKLRHDQPEGSHMGRVQWINIWQPLRGPLNDWPLALCDARSIDPTKDFEPADILYEDRVVENLQIYHNLNQRWYFLSDHQVNEVILFRQADTDPANGLGVPHSSFLNPQCPLNELPRESIEMRALVFHEAQ